MAFLDNSGDIILDAVLTDAGRKRMAEGTFRITKFALADDEIDYSLYNSSDSRGSAYYDLDILSTPVLEAFTDNAAGLKSKLLSISRTDLEYLPVMKLFEEANISKRNSVFNSFIVPVNQSTLDALSVVAGRFSTPVDGMLYSTSRRIAVDQGIDNEAKPYNTEIDASLQETQFIVEIDNRLGFIRDRNSATTVVNPVYIDDDDIASYIRTEDDTGFVLSRDTAEIIKTDGSNPYPSRTSLRGQFGVRLEFSINPTDTLQSTDYMFERIGSSFNTSVLGLINNKNILYIDATVRVLGATTGYRLDIPVRFAKLEGSSGTL